MTLNAFASNAWAFNAWRQNAWLDSEDNLSAENGTYQLTGIAATLRHTYTPVAAQGSYSLTGGDVTFSRSYYLQASTGSYTLDGQSQILTFTTIPPTIKDHHYRVGTAKLKMGW